MMTYDKSPLNMSESSTSLNKVSVSVEDAAFLKTIQSALERGKDVEIRNDEQGKRKIYTVSRRREQ